MLGALHAANALVMITLAWLVVRFTTAQLHAAAAEAGPDPDVGSSR